jgi:arsenate reductase
MAAEVHNVLFLCTGNSARSILAECLLNRLGAGRFRGFSAGSHPKPAPHPVGLKLLHTLGYETEGLRSKSWDEFAARDAVPMHVIVTVCDNAAGETCPVWPGQPLTTHWGVRDPAEARGSEEEQLAMFREVHGELERRIAAFLELPFDALSPSRLQQRLDAIGRDVSKPTGN